LSRHPPKGGFYPTKRRIPARFARMVVVGF
jgi:hypothetical protein